jgi:hypothetical protein
VGTAPCIGTPPPGLEPGPKKAPSGMHPVMLSGVQDKEHQPTRETPAQDPHPPPPGRGPTPPRATREPTDPRLRRPAGRRMLSRSRGAIGTGSSGRNRVSNKQSRPGRSLASRPCRWWACLVGPRADLSCRLNCQPIFQPMPGKVLQGPTTRLKLCLPCATYHRPPEPPPRSGRAVRWKRPVGSRG